MTEDLDCPSVFSHPEVVEEPSATGCDRRSYPRRWANGRASVAYFPHGAVPTPDLADALLQDEGVSGELMDLSRNGFAVVLLQPIDPGEQLIVRLSHSDREDTRDALAKVVRSSSIDGGLWKIVAQFLEPLSFDDAYDLFDHDAETAPH